jgi:hypothetical protein
MMRRIPECLRTIPIWFLSEPYEEPGSAYFNRYSATTLAPLRYNQAGDYTSLDSAVQIWKDHEHWFDGIAFRVSCPWAVLVIQHCVTPQGHLTKKIRDVANRVRGYWELTRNGKDVQAFLLHPQPLQSRGGVVAGHPVFLCGEGVCGVTGRAIPGCGGNPLSTDQDAFSDILREMATAPKLDVLAHPSAISTGASQGEVASRQLGLFDEQ